MFGEVFCGGGLAVLFEKEPFCWEEMIMFVEEFFDSEGIVVLSGEESF